MPAVSGESNPANQCPAMAGRRSVPDLPPVDDREAGCRPLVVWTHYCARPRPFAGSVSPYDPALGRRAGARPAIGKSLLPFGQIVQKHDPQTAVRPAGGHKPYLVGRNTQA
jgi:hypothetical protein